jgi:hypothetical protein
MPNVKTLIKRLEYLVDASVDPDMAIELFNECQEDLSEVSGYANTSKTSVVKGISTVALPLDLISIAELKIKVEGEKDFLRILPTGLVSTRDMYDQDYDEEYYSFEHFGDSVELRPDPEKDADLLIRYYGNLPDLKFPEDFDGPDDPLFLAQLPVLRTRFHRLLPLYGAMKVSQNWKDVLQEKRDFQGEYIMGRQELEEDTRKRKKKTKSKRTYVTRGWN